MESSNQQPPLSKLAVTSLLFSIVGALVFLMSGYGYQWGWWGLYTSFRILIPGGAILGVIGMILAFVFPFVNKSDSPPVRGKGMLYAAAILGLIVVANFGYWFYQAQQYPPIHDITTDTQNPPQFRAIVPLRADAPNATEYGGEEVAKVQKEHYPDIETLVLQEPYPEAFKQALEAAESTSWEIVGYDDAEGRIEATHTLPWYGFKDDVVIRVDTADTDSLASKIDVRSVSRIGRGDIGVNADRIRSYLQRLQ
ncbi:DUF1499 domain-containing protein [Aliifodinibius sp. S!AR15-10]|uniref:DUF1499 domain-containing protein n=1 Tax=Aliifodinibius sp. S!AR15-10 TaxID=2950437 RepID=UPI002855D780|nr:DUF1499 domain-containing protein [Aliifodinibius sp. S!AR15-10]MDR8391049.1 DUF1499 domain-containing protein [Aliifodinibius sp. S!AR15-10]